MKEYLEMLQTLLADKLQKTFDPRYYEVQAELFNMRNRGKRNYLTGQPLIGSDTRGQTMLGLMDADPRWENLTFEGWRRGEDTASQINRPMTPEGMNLLIRKLQQVHKNEAWSNMMQGGGI